MKIEFFLAIGCIIFIACKARDDSLKSTEPLLFSQLVEYQSCVQDSDCIFVNNGCCDCANGGEEAAIHKDQEAAFKARFDCTDVGCSEVARTPACGSGTVTCVNSLCNYSLQ